MEQNAKTSHEERSTSITKQLVFHTRFAVKRAVIEFWSVYFSWMILGTPKRT
jgi:hypothetical protein